MAHYKYYYLNPMYLKKQKYKYIRHSQFAMNENVCAKLKTSKLPRRVCKQTQIIWSGQQYVVNRVFSITKMHIFCAIAFAEMLYVTFIIRYYLLINIGIAVMRRLVKRAHKRNELDLITTSIGNVLNRNWFLRIISFSVHTTSMLHVCMFFALFYFLLVARESFFFFS